MSAAKKLVPGRRNFTLYISVIALVSIFFIGFFFYYVPSNRDALNKYAFSILQSITNNIRQKTRNDVNLYKPYSKIKKNENIDSLNEKLKASNLDGRIDINYSLTNCGDTSLRKLSRRTQDVKYNFGVNWQQFYYSFNDSNKVYVIIPARSMMRELLESRRKDVFESFLLLKVCDGKAYNVYSDINIGQEIIADSLLADQKKGKILLPGIRDIDLKGLTYKMLFIPFNLGNDQLVICGFVKSETYSSQLNLIPVKFIYPIIIAALLLMIALPLIKFYIMGPAETLRLRDMFGFLISIFVGSTLLTLVIIQVILIFDGDIRAQKDIETLSKQIDSSFCNELQLAYRQLEIVDQEVTSRYNASFGPDDKPPERNTSNLLFDYLDFNSKTPKKETAYYNFDRVSWVNETGTQFLKAQFRGSPIFQAVSERKYFSMIHDSVPYMLPGHPDISFGMEPVFNWVNGEFTYVISKKSVFNDKSIVSLSTKLYSVIETILPPGYGFCIIDEEGNVQVHSDLTRSLNENFLEQAVPALPLREAIASRQDMSFNEIKFYGKMFSVNIKPISRLPFHLVTYYDKGYIVPVNMRILIFSLILCFAFYVVLLMLWLFAIRKKHNANPLLYSPMDVLHWVMPKQHIAPYYRRCYKFLACYIGVLLLVVFTQAKFTSLNSNYFVLNIVLFTPINIVCALAIFVDPPPISSLLLKRIRPARVALWSLIGITVFAAIYLAVFAGANVFQLFVFQFLFVIAMILYPYVLKPLSFEISGKENGYIFSYALLIEFLVACFAIMPAGLFTWYSHNQEIIQGVKKQQLYIADKIQKRIHSVNTSLNVWKPEWLPANAYQDAQFRNGVYPIYPTNIRQDSISTNEPQKGSGKKSFEQFYFDLANRVGNNYYDPENYPALQDSSYDNAWFWRGEKEGCLEFCYMLSINNQRKDAGNAINIITQLPPRYIFLSASSKGLMLLIVVLFFLYGLFAIIHHISTRLFLQKYLSPSLSLLHWKGMASLIHPYKTIPNIDPALEKRLATLPREYKKYPPNLGDEQIIEGEKQIIATAKELKSFYDPVWKACTDEQKYLLINFSKSGLMNFKSTADIYSLLDRGVLIQEKGRIQLFSKSFRAYILQLVPSEQIEELAKKMDGNSAWQSFRKPFLLILMGAAAFIFFTQQEAWQRIMALLTAFTTSLPLLLNIFSSSGSKKT